MKRYLVFGMSSQMGGVESFLMNYVGNMMDEENEFEFVFFNSVPEFFLDSPLGCCKYYIVPARTKNCWKFYSGLKAIVKKGNYDILWYNACTLSDITLVKIAAKYKIPCRIVHSHNSENMGNKLAGLFHNIHKKCIFKYATEFFACSKEAAIFMFPEYVKNVQIINNAIQVENYKFDNNIRQKVRNNLGLKNEILLGHVGRFHTQKNHEFLIDIFGETVKKRSSVRLLLIGDGSIKRKIQQLAKDKEIFDRIIFLEKRTDVNELLQAMDIFVFPSLFEGLGLALIEAQAADLPCVIADTIPEAAILTEKVSVLSLDSPAKEWADTVLESAEKYHNRNDRVELLKQKRYDIAENAELLKKYICSKY